MLSRLPDQPVWKCEIILPLSPARSSPSKAVRSENSNAYLPLVSTHVLPYNPDCSHWNCGFLRSMRRTVPLSHITWMIRPSFLDLRNRVFFCCFTHQNILLNLFSVCLLLVCFPFWFIFRFCFYYKYSLTSDHNLNIIIFI